MKNEANTKEGKIDIPVTEAQTSNGLTAEQVHARMDAGLNNCEVTSSTMSVSEIVKSNLFTYFNLIFVILAVLLALVGAWKDMLFLGVVVSNTAIGIIQEIHSKRVLDKLSILNAPHTRTIRDGQEITLPSEELVRDDLVIFQAGSQIPADAVVVDGQLLVNESLITGEADEIKKEAGADLLSGSFVTSGQATARLTKVGEESYISKLTMQATRTDKEEKSEMIRSLDRLILVMGIMIIPIGIALFVQSYLYNELSLFDSITGMVAAVIGMIPEGLYLLATVAMAASTVRLAKKQVLIHDMKCIETLARVNVLCVDKTGTITEPGMQVDRLIPLAEQAQTSEPAPDAAADKNSTEPAPDAAADDNTSALYALLSDFVAALPKDNATMEAMQAYFTKGSGQRAKKISTFSSETKYSGVELDGGTYVIGAPEFVLRELMKNDRTQMENDRTQTENERMQTETYRTLVEEYSGQGYRVLVFAAYDGALDGKALSQKVTPLALLLLSNPIRKGAKDTFSYFAEREVEIKVISGDNPLTVSVVAEKAGIAGAERYVDASTLQTKEDIYEAAEKYTVFGRVTPDQKRQLVAALKAHKKTVAMTGDGVNDVLALKDADCSIAMASGSDAASNVSQLVLLDSDFSRMPSVVMEGRRVVNNIQRTASLYIVKNIFSMCLAIFSVLLMWEYPLEPTQVTLISMFTIGIPSTVLALEQNKDRISGHFMTNVLVKALPAGLTDFLVVSGLVLFCREFEVDLDCLSTSCTILIGIVGFMILYRIAKPITRMHAALLIGLAAGWLFCMLKAGDFFAITGISRQCAMLTVVFAIATEPLLRYLSLAVEGIAHGVSVFWQKRRQKKRHVF
jgi:cation-transporting ATPase E